jgi:hypothetical protein
VRLCCSAIILSVQDGRALALPAAAATAAPRARAVPGACEGRPRGAQVWEEAAQAQVLRVAPFAPHRAGAADGAPAPGGAGRRPQHGEELARVQVMLPVAGQPAARRAVLSGRGGRY